MAKPISQPRPPDQGGRVTYAKFLAGADEDTLAEWVDWLWQDPLPDAVQTLLQVDRAAYAAYLREQLRRAAEG